METDDTSAEVAVEVDHSGLHRLRKCASKQVLEHTITGECVECPAGGPWDLALSDRGRAYIHAAGNPSHWVTALLRSSIWRRGNCQLLQHVMCNHNELF